MRPFPRAKYSGSRSRGIMAAKRTGELIPLAIRWLSKASRLISICLCPGYEINVALKTADQIRGLDHRENRRGDGSPRRRLRGGMTIYDMCKAIDKTMVIDGVRLLEKTGGSTRLTAGGTSSR